MMNDPDFMEALSSMIAQALKASIGNAVQQAQADQHLPAGEAAAPSPRVPSFTMSEFRSTDGTSVTDYFSRFEWALQLSHIPEAQYANFARVHMGTELNNALKFLVTPRQPAEIPYEELRTTLSNHFDRIRNKFVESVKFRQIIQQPGESIAQFVLRLKQGAAYCEYEEFLDRMLIEQLLHGLEARDICDEIIAKKPETFSAAYEIAHSLEATRNTTREISNTTNTPSPDPESTNKLGYEKPKTKKFPKSLHRSPPRKLNESPSDNAAGSSSCYGCGGQHLRSQCRFRDEKCRNCNKRGHIAKVCRSLKSNSRNSSADQVELHEMPSSEVDFVQAFNQVHQIPAIEKKTINVKIDGRPLGMELDTGAPCGLVGEIELRRIKPKFTLLPTDRRFSSYTGHRINCLGRLPVNVSMGSTTRRLNLYVVSGASEALFGREWITHFTDQIDWNEMFSSNSCINSVTSITTDQAAKLSKLLENFENIFSEVPGKLEGPSAKVHLKPEVSPVFARAREVLLALRDRYAAEIEKKVASGFYEKVDYSEWASPTHIVMKKNGGMRITGNYKPTVNPKMIIDEHPIPKIETIFNKMKGAALFCHLDITDVYTHLPIDDEFRHVLTLNTPTHGLIRPTRAVYGAANIPAIWQRRMESVLQGLDHVVNFYDDIIVFAKDFEELMLALTATMDRIRQHGLRLNRKKCIFATPSLECLGHRIDHHGLHKSEKHIEAIRDAPRPTTPEELQLFLEPFEWTPEANEAYRDLKLVLTSPQVLIQYDPTLPLILATDASKTGLGAVLSHRLSNGTERPIAYASCTMSSTEQRYPQIDKEALAIVWAVKKFFYYLYARKFTLITDHKPLTQILHPEKSLPTLCISRMANYADYLAHFNFNVVYKPTSQNTNADYCSRIPSKSTNSGVHSLFLEEGRNDVDGFDNFALHQIQQLPVRAEYIARETRKDAHLGKLLQLLELGRNLAQSGYKAPESKYTVVANCLLFEHRVVIPPTFREAILNDLHAAHIGVVKMKGLARSFVYWPGIDADIENIAKSCAECARHAPAPPKFNSHHWEYPKGPWERIHIDYAGPVAGMMLLIIVDAYSKWVEVKVTNSTTALATINILDDLFAAYGAPVTVVSDNGPQFTADEFKVFLHRSGVKYHKLSAPYHPATNGQAERYVQTVKRALKAMGTTNSTLQANLNKFLMQYRKAPHTETGESPAKLFLGRNIRTRLDLVRPQDTSTKITEKQRAFFDASFRTFSPGQHVYCLSGNPRLDKWIPGIITARLGDLHYDVVYQGKHLKRHIDQLRRFHDNESNESIPFSSESRKSTTGSTTQRMHFYDDAMTSQQHSFSSDGSTTTEASSNGRQTPEPSFVTPTSSPTRSSEGSPPILRRSERQRRLPLRYSP
ncbi:uncharacterized protein K02A2.6-like isoform X2 [Uranotaenia lowii]|uniref:uncharacterized protein K02A2.6-like isoform X2 n=1 Tax=Uranotaenia lowii TaxID=190385 RepID=UPI0024796BF2|nr:uncharacterized protein K02A2.6-like isoform X2 [Uranotaenia lowii]